MAIVKLINLSQKVQVLIRKHYCEDDEMSSITIETVIDHDVAQISASLINKYKSDEARDEAFDNIESFDLKKIANSMIKAVINDNDLETYIIE